MELQRLDGGERQYRLLAATGGGLALLEAGRGTDEDRELLRIQAIELKRFVADVDMLFGFFTFAREEEQTEPLTLAPRDQGFVLADAAGNALGRLELALVDGELPRFSISVTQSADAAAIRIRMTCSPEARFWGMGEQYNNVDLRGRTVPSWAQEQGVGRRDKSAVPPIGSFEHSYFPLPYVFDPAAGVGVLLRNNEYAEFDLCDSDPDEWAIETWSSTQMVFDVLPGPQPANLVEQLTGTLGRLPSAPPDWSFAGVWLAAQGGRAAVSERLEAALAAGIPVAAMWVQDWLGIRRFSGDSFGVRYHWVGDQELYPDLGDMIADWNARGVEFLGYFNPFVVPDYDQYATAAAAGYLVTNPDGEPYRFPIITFDGGLIDVTNDAAVAYFQSFAVTAVSLGMAGWMADFGEWLPFDAQLAGGNGALWHNRYASEWHRINRAVLERLRGDDFVLLTRSGYSEELAIQHVVWAGDQEASWEANDGLPTVVTAGLTSGLSGVAVFTHDIAGFSGGPSSRELFLRWTELGAFTPIMRTHDGLRKLENHRFDSDETTTAHFAKFARAHAALAPLWQRLAAQAVATGLPMIRHTVLVDPDWDVSLAAHSQWMLGDTWLFAPVVEQGVDRVTVHFPVAGATWRHVFSDRTFAGRSSAEVAAPIGQPALFTRVDADDPLLAAVRAALR